MGIPKLNETEIFVISALVGDELYGLQIVDEVAKISGGRRKMSLGGLYTTLHRMEQKGLVTGRWGEATEERAGARRRYYAVTGAGARAFKEAAAALAPALKPAARLG